MRIGYFAGQTLLYSLATQVLGTKDSTSVVVTSDKVARVGLL